MRQNMKCVIYCPQCTTWVLKIWKYQLQENNILGIHVHPSRLISWKVEICLLCFVYHWVEISPTMMLSVVLFLPMNCPWWVGVHQGGFVVFRHLVQELQNITEQFWKRYSTKSKLNILVKLGWALGTAEKPLMSGISWRWFPNF
jgi:hypothetical protein